MKRLFVILSGLFLALSASGQDLPAAWEELTSPDFVKATQKSEGVCSYSGDMHPPKKQICLYFMT